MRLFLMMIRVYVSSPTLIPMTKSLVKQEVHLPEVLSPLKCPYWILRTQILLMYIMHLKTDETLNLIKLQQERKSIFIRTKLKN